MNFNFFNLSKRKKRDLLDELLVGTSPEGIISKKELNALKRLIAAQSSDNSSVNMTKSPVKPKKGKDAGKNLTNTD